jgi:hypothetical protein
MTNATINRESRFAQERANYAADQLMFVGTGGQLCYQSGGFTGPENIFISVMRGFRETEASARTIQ